MAELSFPWLTLLVALPTLASAITSLRLGPETVRRVSLAGVGLTLAVAIAVAWVSAGQGPLRDPLLGAIAGRPLLGVDELSALLLPFGALVFALVVLVMPLTRLGTHEEPRTLAAEAIVLATFCAQDPVVLAVLWALAIIPPLLALRARGEATARTLRVFAVYMGFAVVTFVAGAVLLAVGGDAALVGSALVTAAVLVRKGIVPVHSWLPPLMERGPMSLATLFSVPQLGAYAFVRLVLPTAPDDLLSIVGELSLLTAVYGAALALVQTEARRAFGFLFLSESALVLAGLEGASEVGLTGALVVWLSAGLALTGFGMTLRVLEARRGDLSLLHFHGGYRRTPLLAACFLLLGLASAGFPGTLGFIGGELLIDGAVAAHPQVGFAVVLAAALNGITVIRMYGVLFAGARRHAPSSQRLRRREAFGFLTLVSLLLAGGLAPRALVSSRARAAAESLESRTSRASTPNMEVDPDQSKD